VAQDRALADARRLIPAPVLARIPGCESGQLPNAVTVLAGGTVNTSLRVQTRAGSYVVRLHDPAGRFLGADHAREAQLQAAAAAAGLAPAVVYADPAQGFMITQFVAGRPWEAADFSRPELLWRLGERLRALHTLKAPVVARFDLGAILRHHAAELVRALPAEEPLLLALLRAAEAALALCMQGGRGAAIVHNDLHHSNLIQARELCLIDWEYAAVADPIFDLACVLAYYPVTQSHAQSLRDAAGLATAGSAQELAAATSLFVLLSFLWYRRRRLTSAVEAADLATEQALLRRLGV
jgi:aminoglycoside phosphotransferase (APT) family kinase protein